MARRSSAQQVQWPADQIERWPIARLIPYARNARTHSDAQIAQIAASIREWGWTMPVLADEDGTIIAGHGRVLAARQLGMQEVPVMIARGWSDAQRRAYTLADNQLALKADWDLDTLRIELADLRDAGIELSVAGFEAPELDQLFADETTADTEWQGMPDFKQEDQLAWHSVKVNFQDQAALDDFARLLGQKLTNETRSIWHPIAERMQVKDKRYASTAEESEP